MSLALNKPKLNNLTQDIWKSAERLRGKFKPYEYQSIILPIIVLRRLECVLTAWREAKAKDIQKKAADAGKPRTPSAMPRQRWCSPRSSTHDGGFGQRTRESRLPRTRSPFSGTTLTESRSTCLRSR